MGGMFTALRVIVRTLSMSADSLLWSMCLLAFIIVGTAILMVQLCTQFIEDPLQPETMRLFLYRHFGSPNRATYSIFEATFTAKWTNYAEKMVLELNPYFAIFWALFV